MAQYFAFDGLWIRKEELFEIRNEVPAIIYISAIKPSSCPRNEWPALALDGDGSGGDMLWEMLGRIRSRIMMIGGADV